MDDIERVVKCISINGEILDSFERDHVLRTLQTQLSEEDESRYLQLLYDHGLRKAPPPTSEDLPF